MQNTLAVPEFKGVGSPGVWADAPPPPPFFLLIRGGVGLLKMSYRILSQGSQVFLVPGLSFSKKIILRIK